MAISSNLIDCCTWTPAVIPSLGCPNTFGQVVRLGFQVQQSTPSFPTAADLVDITDWTTLLAAAALTTRIYLTPTSQDGKTGLFMFSITGGAPITQGGGDDSTFGGIPATVDYEFSKWAITGYDLSADVIAGLKGLLRCGKNLTMYMFNTAGQIIARKNVTSYEGFGVTSINIPDISHTSYRERSTVLIEGYIEKNYDTVAYVSPATTFSLTMVNA